MTWRSVPHSVCDARGTALLVAVMYLLVVTMLATGLLTLLNHSIDYFQDVNREVERRYIAEAGVEKALVELRTNGSAYAGENGTPLGDGAFSVEVRQSARVNGYEIVSSASLDDVGTGHTQILVDAVPESTGAFRVVRWVEVKKR
ncbi:MAG: hypothetical protein AMXMBFR4_31710 [Candidatus Hydrogenedentota bacterium]